MLHIILIPICHIGRKPKLDGFFTVLGNVDISFLACLIEVARVLFINSYIQPDARVEM